MPSVPDAYRPYQRNDERVLLPCVLGCVATISLDTSAWMINGDYIPNRLEAQQDAGTCAY